MKKIPTLLPLENYKAKLREKYGNSNMAGTVYMGHTVPVGHTCISCGSTFFASPRQMLTYKTQPVCVKCVRTTSEAKTSDSGLAFTKKLLRKFDGITCLRYASPHRPSDFKCSCGHEWTAKPIEVIKTKYGCPACSLIYAIPRTKRYELKDLVRVMKARCPTLSLINTSMGEPKGQGVKVSCTVCSHEWRTEVPKLMGNEEHCPVCRQIDLWVPSDASLEGRTVFADPHAAKVFKYLTETDHIQASRIRILPEPGIRSVSYMVKGSRKEYWPSMRAGKVLIEIRTLKGLPHYWENLRAAARACVKLGYSLRVLVVHREHTYELPKEYLTWKVEDAEAYVRIKTVKKLRILSMDPGVTNFAWAILEVARPFKVKIIATGMLDNTIKELTSSIKEGTQLFRNEILELREEYSIDHMIMERFMSRGMKGLTIELVNVMIGVMMGMWSSNSRAFKLITAAQWKNEWNRRADLKEFYTKVDCEVHQVDAIGIGLYGAAYWFDQEPFKDIAHVESSLIKQIKKANVER